MPCCILRQALITVDSTSLPSLLTTPPTPPLQRLKAALHYTVGRVCEEVEDVTFSRELIATISETAFRQCQVLATDLEQFARYVHQLNQTLLLLFPQLPASEIDSGTPPVLMASCQP